MLRRVTAAVALLPLTATPGDGRHSMITALLALAVAAPPQLSLPDLLREAREKNPELRAAQAQVRAMKENVPAAGALDDPTLSVQLWNAPVDFSSIPLMVE